MAKENNVSSQPDRLYFFVALPILFAFMIFTYLFAERLSVTNSKVCTFLGKIWLVGSPTDSNVLKGCYTYQQLAEKGQL